ncbi:Capsule biosynthesis protein capA [hydrothermal vent metagenome]|uniref:Capsule biosynthesis protein capA n=1 Tax=hydrothermal vent metagenome TaxID=652676 RepID=A0A3B0SWN7_9ZZZZ
MNKFIYGIILTTFFTIHSISAQEVTLIAGGDVEWSRMINKPKYYYDSDKASEKMRKDGWRRLSFIASDESKSHMINTYGVDPDSPKKHHIKSIPLNLEFSTVEEEYAHPFLKIAPILKKADIAFINLETPLSDTARQIGAFKTSTAFAKAIKDAGVDVVSTANNHSLDAEGVGLIETKEVLLANKIEVIGTGFNLEDARKPVIIEKDNIKIAFLAYTYGVNPTRTDIGFAFHNRSGAMPLDPFLIKEDIKRVRQQVDYIVLSFHWGLENKQEIHPASIEFAHDMIDSGADVILGHHPHVPRGIEIYNGKPIVYSMGNLIFGHTHTNWKDNFLARITFSKKKICKLEIVPVAGKMQDIGQPFVLDGDRAKEFLEEIKTQSEPLNTTLTIKKNIGTVRIKK